MVSIITIAEDIYPQNLSPGRMSTVTKPAVLMYTYLELVTGSFESRVFVVCTNNITETTCIGHNTT